MTIINQEVEFMWETMRKDLGYYFKGIFEKTNESKFLRKRDLFF